MGLTAGAIITASLRDLGVLQEGSNLSAAQGQDGLTRLNHMVAGWRTQYATVTSVDRMVFPLIANKQTYSIGTGADFNVPRPLSVNGAGLWLNALGAEQVITSMTRVLQTVTVTSMAHGLAVGDEANIGGATQVDYNGLQTVETVPTANTFTFTVDGNPSTPAAGTLFFQPVVGVPTEIPRPLITDDAYQFNQLKNMPNNQFTTVYYNPTYPYGTVVLWPLPNVATNQLVLYLKNVFEGFSDINRAYDWPDLPGYAEALQYNLNLRLAIPYQGSITPDLRDAANQTLGLIKRANNKLMDLPNDAALLTSDQRGGYNINTGTGGG